MYLWLKLVHVAAVVAFLGNITTGLFWHAHAARTRDPALLAHTIHGIIRSDRIFTLPGVVVIIVSGVGTAIIGNYPILATPWILWSLVLFSVSGLVFVLRVAPLQVQLRTLARAGAEQGAFDWAAYRHLSHAWERGEPSLFAHAHRGPRAHDTEADLLGVARGGQGGRRAARSAG